MSGSLFTPKIRQVVEPVTDSVTPVPEQDGAGKVLLKVSQYSVITLFGLIPVFFIPGLFASLGFDKTILTIIVGVIVTISIFLLALRRREVGTVVPLALVLFWSGTLLAFVSGFLSGDVQDAIRGTVMETQTVGFLATLALVMTIPLVLQGSKNMTIKALAIFGLAAIVLVAYILLRLVFGTKFLAFSSFKAITSSPIGGFNDLAIFSGLTIIFGLVTLVQLPLRKWIQYVIAILIIMSLIILMVVNFFNIWMIIGFFSLLLFVYLLSRDILFSSSPSVATSGVLIFSTVAVCIVSALFVVAGDYAGSKVSKLTSVDYVEVRPSMNATIDVARSVYKDDLVFGVGPNRFADAWRLYKDRSINETIFWDTDFNAGSGFVPTLFINLGLAGGVLMILFHFSFIYLGYKMLLRSTIQDSYWYYFGVVSFTSALFLWLMSYIYVPGAAILLLAAFFTGLAFVAYGALIPSKVRRIALVANRQRGFVFMALAILVITASISVLFSVGKQYIAQADFSKAQFFAESTAALEQIAMNSFELFPDDRFVSARAQIQLANMNALISIPEPTEEDLQRFGEVSRLAVTFADQAIAEDSTNPDHYAILAGVLSNLALVGGNEAQVRADAALKRAQQLDPLNPGYRLLAARMAVRTGDFELARSEIAAALDLKRNFTEALFLSAQIDINEGKVDSAISTTKAIINMEPNNPTRYYQLGVLLSSSDDLPDSMSAFRTAIALDPNYANARYLLALALINSGQEKEAVEHLKIVQQFNQDNTDLKELIEKIEAGEVVSAPNLGLEAPVSDSAPDTDFDEAVITSEDVESDLVKPVNTISSPARTQASVPDSQEVLMPEGATSSEVSE